MIYNIKVHGQDVGSALSANHGDQATAHALVAGLSTPSSSGTHRTLAPKPVESGIII